MTVASPPRPPRPVRRSRPARPERLTRPSSPARPAWAARPPRAARPEWATRPARSADPARPPRPPRPSRPSRPAPARPRRAGPQRDRTVLAKRVRAFRLVLVLLVVVVVARLLDVQVLHAGQYAQEGAQEVTQQVSLTAQRGAIYDRNGQALALSLPTDMVLADDFQIAHPMKEASALAPLLGMTAAKLVPLLSQHSGYVPLVKHLATTRADKVVADAFPGITLVPTSRRELPNGQLASPVIGMVNGAGVGAAGLEYQYNHDLAGKAGSETLLESPSGVPLPGSPVATKTSATAGKGLELTLDEPLQYTTEQALGAQIAASHAVSGEAVVMDVRTGQILSMVNLVATHPAPVPAGTPPAKVATPVTIGPSGPVSEAPSNLAVTQDYEPGSVFKIVTFSAALADGVTTPTTTYTVPWTRQLDGITFHDATYHPVQQLTATTILAQSSNVGTSFIATGVGESRLLAQVKRLGFGSPTGLGFPGDSPGIVIGPTQWNPTDFVDLPIGQVDAVSALQVLDAYNAIANGGVFVAPKLVRATVGANGQVRATRPSATHRVVPANIATELGKMFEQVVNAGTGMAAAVPGYLIAGKTGTSQVPSSSGGFVTGDFDATFVGFAPANHPVLSAIVVLDNPQPIYGGAVAAPVFSQVMRYALHRYDIPTSPGLNGKPQATASGTLAQLVKESA